MESAEIRRRFLAFFEERGHTVVPSASLLLNDPTLLFVNAWSPDWMTTVEGRWQVVPGSWSVSVEFCFYFAFPLIALFVRNALQACAFALAITKSHREL